MTTTIKFYKVSAVDFASMEKKPYALYFLDNGELYRGTTKIQGGSIVTLDDVADVDTTPDFTSQAGAIEGTVAIADVTGTDYKQVWVKTTDDWVRIDQTAQIDELSARIDQFESDTEASLSSISWDKVFLDEDFTFAGNYTLGNKKTSTGTAYTVSCLNTDGTKKSVEQMFTEVFMQRYAASITKQPSVTVTVSPATQDLEVGSTPAAVTFTASLDAGSYKYGPATGVTASEWEITNAVEADKAKSSGSVNTGFGTVTTTAQSVTVTAKATYEDGVLAKDNTGSTEDGVKIAAGSKSNTATAKVTGYRASFIGYKTSTNKIADPEAITSDEVRGLMAKGVKVPYTDDTTKTYSLDTDKMIQIFVAVPAGTYEVDSIVSNKTGLPLTFYKALNVSVAGANSYTATDYDVYYVSNGSAGGGAETFTITFK